MAILFKLIFILNALKPPEKFYKSKPRKTWQCNSEMHTKNAKGKIAEILLKNNLLRLDVGDIKLYYKAIIITINWYYYNHRYANETE